MLWANGTCCVAPAVVTVASAPTTPRREAVGVHVRALELTRFAVVGTLSFIYYAGRSSRRDNSLGLYWLPNACDVQIVKLVYPNCFALDESASAGLSGTTQKIDVVAGSCVVRFCC